MFSKLDEVEKRFEEIAMHLSNPDVVANQSLYQKFAKERSDLTELIETYRQYKKTVSELADNKHLIETEKDEEIRNMAKDEMSRLEQEVETLITQLKFLLIPKDPFDEKNVILEIRAGTGGDEAALFAADLFRMYSKYAESKRWKVEVTDDSPTGIGGFKEIIALISGHKVYSELKYESGVHRVQRVPKTEGSGRIHTSAVTVAVIPEAEEIDIDINEKDLKVDVFRASGPGGQGVNTTDSAVRVTHLPSNTVVVCRDERSQIKNKAKAMKILRSRLYEHKKEEQDREIRDSRRAQVGSGDRSEKIRTYNFPQNRITDHRIGLTLHKLDRVLDGELEETVSALRTFFQSEAMRGDGK